MAKKPNNKSYDDSNLKAWLERDKENIRVIFEPIKDKKETDYSRGRTK